jgi:hypothetical protein
MLLENKFDLVDRNSIVDRYYAEWEANCAVGGKDPVDWLRQCIEQADVVDACIVSHGYWIHDAMEYVPPLSDEKPFFVDVMQCSVCKEYFDPADARNYCSNCGAKMDGDFIG